MKEQSNQCMVRVTRFWYPILAAAPPHEIVACNAFKISHPILPRKCAQMANASVNGGERALLNFKEKLEAEEVGFPLSWDRSELRSL